MPEHLRAVQRGAYMQPWQPAEIPVWGVGQPARGTREPLVLAYGVGDWREAIIGAIAGRELDLLMSAVRSLADDLVGAIEARGPVLEGWRRAKALAEEAQRLFGPPILSAGLASVPNPKTLPAMMALGTARKGVQVFARQVQTLTLLDRVFTAISAELTRAGVRGEAEAVDATLRQLRRFVFETDNLMGAVPDYMDAKRAILSAAASEWAAWRVPSDAIGDPRWLAAYVKAADRVVPLPGRPGAPAELGQAGLSDLGSPLAPLIAAIIWIVAIIAFAVVAANSIARLIPDQNSKAETARALLLAAEERKRQVELEMRRQGKSQAEINQAKASIDAEVKEVVAEIPEPKSPLAALLLPVGILVAGAFAAKAAGVL